jgi:hypothetical protein
MLVLTSADLRGLDARGFESLLDRRDCVVAVGSGELRGYAAAGFLFSDYAALHRGGTVVLDSAVAWAGAVWRAGRRVWLGEPLEDEIIDGDDWFDRWIQHRSAAALDAAAMLARSRGGDVLERAEFARLFATGEPAEGLAAFLGKRRPSFIVRNGRTP